MSQALPEPFRPLSFYAADPVDEPVTMVCPRCKVAYEIIRPHYKSFMCPGCDRPMNPSWQYKLYPFAPGLSLIVFGGDHAS